MMMMIMRSNEAQQESNWSITLQWLITAAHNDVWNSELPLGLPETCDGTLSGLPPALTCALCACQVWEAAGGARCFGCSSDIPWWGTEAELHPGAHRPQPPQQGRRWNLPWCCWLRWKRPEGGSRGRVRIYWWPTLKQTQSQSSCCCSSSDIKKANVVQK